MSEEEKKAIQHLYKYLLWETFGERALEKDIKTVLNLIEKQQKEIEELKESINYTWEQYQDTGKKMFKYEEENKLKQKEIEQIKWKPISEYNREKYDWVLIKYFDNNYECVPNVAELRANGKWYNHSDREIPFEVKYFFDMQVIKGE